MRRFRKRPILALTHSWVNLDFMLDGCMIGFLAPEDN